MTVAVGNKCDHLGANGVSAIRKLHSGQFSWTQCTLCAKTFSEDKMSRESTWQETKGVGSGYYCRTKGLSTWQFISWKELGNQNLNTRENVETLINLWNDAPAGVEYATVQCGGCHAFHNLESWVGTHCDKCSKLPSVKLHKGEALVASAPMKNGDVRKLAKSSSPMWTEQWAAMGTAKIPYIVSRSKGHASGSTTADGWACSCSDFKKHTPRADCKHIIRVQKKEGLLGKYSPSGAGVTGLSAEQAEAFKKFMAAEHAKKLVAIANEDGGIKMLGDDQGRRFR